MKLYLTHILEYNRGHILQRRFQVECLLALLLQQQTALGRIGALFDKRIVFQPNLFSTTLARIRRIGKVVALLHQTIDIVERLGYTSVLRLERVHLNVFDGARMHFVAVALVRTVMAVEDDIGTLRGELVLCAGP